MKNLKILRAQQDHLHFSNKCCECLKTVDDKKIVPVYVERLSGFPPEKIYLEPDYCCEDCLRKEKEKCL